LSRPWSIREITHLESYQVNHAGPARLFCQGVAQLVERAAGVRSASGTSQGRKLIASCACSKLRRGRDRFASLTCKYDRDREVLPLSVVS
jgi:hypothetical protein